MMNRKIGKFKLWQLLALGGGLGLIIYERSKSKAASVNPGEGELVGSTNNPLSGGGGGEGFGGLSQAPPSPLQVELVSQPAFEPRVENFPTPEVHNAEAEKANNGLPKAALKPAPLSGKFPQTNSKTGKKYKTVKRHGKTEHVYQDGHHVVLGEKKTPHTSSNPNHRASHAAPVSPINHSRPAPLKVPSATPGIVSAPARTVAPSPKPAPKPNYLAKARAKGHW